ncbi:MAG TPA: serine hydrolase [Polyangiaceae bacterium]|nr:serine hydrolase [Polyangiaceae bacterium]
MKRSRGRRFLVALVLGTLLASVCTVGWLAKRHGLRRVWMGITLFHGAEQYENFAHTAELFPASTMPRSEKPFHFPEGPRITLPASFAYEGKPIDVEWFLSETDTSALLVLKDGAVRYERYALTGGRDVHWLSWSVAKSFISALVGIAIADGYVRSVEDPITRYVPALVGSGYDGVRIKDVLQMSSGVGWDETYANPFSDVNRFGRVLFLGGSLDEFTATLERKVPPGTRNHYCSADTHALGMLLTRATGRSVTAYMNEKLWQPLGMESSGRWLLDDHGMEMVFGGLNATARDYAKLGELYRLGGAWQGKQIVPETWVRQSVTPDAPFLTAEAKAKAGEPFPIGYGYQWWIPGGDEHEFSAIGIYNQFVYVNPTRGVVIVKLSAFSDYATGWSESAYREMQTVELFRAIARTF